MLPVLPSTHAGGQHGRGRGPCEILAQPHRVESQLPSLTPGRTKPWRKAGRGFVLGTPRCAPLLGGTPSQTPGSPGPPVSRRVPVLPGSLVPSALPSPQPSTQAPRCPRGPGDTSCLPWVPDPVLHTRDCVALRGSPCRGPRTHRGLRLCAGSYVGGGDTCLLSLGPHLYPDTSQLSTQHTKSSSEFGTPTLASESDNETRGALAGGCWGRGPTASWLPIPGAAGPGPGGTLSPEPTVCSPPQAPWAPPLASGA